MITSNSIANKVRPVRGFTLVELMIVVAIVAILAAVAYPSYLQHIRKSRRADRKLLVGHRRLGDLIDSLRHPASKALLAFERKRMHPILPVTAPAVVRVGAGPWTRPPNFPIRDGQPGQIPKILVPVSRSCSR